MAPDGEVAATAPDGRAAGDTAYELLSTNSGKWWVTVFINVQIAYLVFYLAVYHLHLGGNFVPVAMCSVSLVNRVGALLLTKASKDAVASSRFQMGQAFVLIADGVLFALGNAHVQIHLDYLFPDIWQWGGRAPRCAAWDSLAPQVCKSSIEYWLIGQYMFSSQVLFYTIAVLRFKVASFAASISAILFTLIVIGCHGSNLSAVWVLQTSFIHTSMLCTLVVGGLLTKRTLEKCQRDLLKELALKDGEIVHERVLRCEAEWRMEHVSPTKAKKHDCDSSAHTVPISDKYFNILPTPNEGEDACLSLDGLVKLGEREHWLVPRYEVNYDRGKEVLGKGSHGTVVMGEAYGSEVALKFAEYQSEEGDDPTLARPRWHKKVRALVNELRVLRQVRHPNIVLFHGALIDPTELEIGIVMEFVAGPTLTQFIKRSVVARPGPLMRKLNERTQYHLMVTIASALRYLHGVSPPIVHGDLKPDNICIENPEAVLPRPKLLDFGLSCILGKSSNKLGGTVRWMAPEVLTREPPQPTVAADTYSFACVSFFIITGIQPFDNLKASEIVKYRAMRKPLGLHWPLTPISQRCHQELIRCLAAEVEERPDMRWLHLQLRRFQLMSVEEACPSAASSQQITPLRTRLTLLLLLMQRCKVTAAPPLTCCKGHDVMLLLMADLESLFRCSCSLAQLGISGPSATESAQCSSCLALLINDAKCSICDATGDGVFPFEGEPISESDSTGSWQNTLSREAAEPQRRTTAL
eukprot:gb/GFBE01038161.1/.p1 GENE.gb/GFBE01038161.1/~~gb/GFBE01038161.1/.p1  ORF type:complete len:752 (+),score=91.93 gb/GFBE01038161.1/:1-2256(+)